MRTAPARTETRISTRLNRGACKKRPSVRPKTCDKADRKVNKADSAQQQQQECDDDEAQAPGRGPRRPPGVGRQREPQRADARDRTGAPERREDHHRPKGDGEPFGGMVWRDLGWVHTSAYPGEAAGQLKCLRVLLSVE